MSGLASDVSLERDESLPDREMALIKMLLQKRSESLLGKDMAFTGSERTHPSDIWQQRQHPSSGSSVYRGGDEVNLMRGGTALGYYGAPADLRLPPVSSGGKASTSLPLKLVSMLSNPDFSDVVTWMPHGRAWKILDLDAFTKQVLPVFFDCGSYPNNFNTFVKMLKLWGFRQFTKGPDASAYFNPLFIRGMPHLRRMMRPTHESGPLHDAHNEPDFYILPPPSTPGFTAVDPQERIGTSTTYPTSPPQHQHQPLHDLPFTRMMQQQRTASAAKIQALRSLMRTETSPNGPVSLPVLPPLPDHDHFMRADRRYSKPTLSWRGDAAVAAASMGRSPSAASGASDPYWLAAAAIPYNSAAYYGHHHHQHPPPHPALVAELQAAQDLHDQTLQYLMSSEKMSSSPAAAAAAEAAAAAAASAKDRESAESHSVTATAAAAAAAVPNPRDAMMYPRTRDQKFLHGLAMSMPPKHKIPTSISPSASMLPPAVVAASPGSAAAAATSLTRTSTAAAAASVVQVEANTAPRTPVGSSHKNEERLSVKTPANIVTPSSGNTPGVGVGATASTKSLPSALPLSSSSSSSPSTNKKTTTTRRKWLPPLDAGGIAPGGGGGGGSEPPKKKQRRKWLPPLGPKDTSIGTTTKDPSGRCEWYFSNPETFAALNDSANKKGYW